MGQSISSLAGILTHKVRGAPKMLRVVAMIGSKSRILFVVYSVKHQVVPPMINDSMWPHRISRGEAVKLLFTSQSNHPVLLVSGQRKYEEAEPLYRKALAIGEKAYDPHHPEVATNLHNLAALLQCQVWPTTYY